MTRTINRNDAFTGLEAAIVLIAFVVVAAVFSYVVLGAGFFTTQKSQEVVHTGVGQASTNLEIQGEVYGIRADVLGDGGSAAISRINFTIGLAAGGSPVDLSQMQIYYQNTSYMDRIGTNANIYFTAPAVGTWSVYQMLNADTNDVLEKGEQMMISVRLANPVPSHFIAARDEFNLEVKPAIGAAFGIARTGPAAFDPVNKLY